ncbi:hypothetical protein [Thioalkalivibrio sp. HK1]|uniref:hypothetical protein n=1 Tax=Thioalkalivibrio sp. HK1 TaxID=1469245 RepID=UPI00047031FB|nr:hypothetical protein [Thioalkalivibrio sp. HK1]
MSKPYEEKWLGASGQEYLYSVHSVNDHRIGKTFDNVPGNYIFAKKTYPSGEFSPIYIGQSGNLSERFEDHHKNSCIRRRGATHIFVHRNDDENVRLAEEKDLLDNSNPPCNE